ncbi:divalent-cation tolerance protein CutA [Cupriavidus gilardii]|uniref:Divalent-cation tolerance protein CutA n=1 Tax=Cupriavidus gilardii TaxID=82541 RepID=A0ABY4VTV8_9BURK|nr:divalent-cation tolerance protein CutA [Cupriavidus gilardii]MCT9073957.1 divalent-cation tolerance protein CutA [Cupriavidus gilardii]QKS60586.1 divalent-cation tolerance protein CutA [Cupriavidus gilardii]USE80405.1 divalent-cation tolerance protein CutA [Cupriavidus gilardii]
MDASQVLVVITTLPDEDSAAALTRALLEARVAACVNRMPACESQYWWQGTIETARELPLLIKTTRACYDALEAAIRHHHPYDVPEIVALPVQAGLPAYLDWVVQQTATPGGNGNARRGNDAA